MSAAVAPLNSPQVEGPAAPKTVARNNRSITELVSSLAESLDRAILEIDEINDSTRLLSVNASIEAAHAGVTGAAFGVVAQTMKELSGKTAQAARALANSTKQTIDELMELIGNQVRGTRLSDIALVNIDLIDRNLYERTCDVRWWATDSSLVDALTLGTPEAVRFASHRMGVILDAYTVYFDLVLCDLAGKVIANGRPADYDAVGLDQSREPWFVAAAATASGNEFGFQSTHPSRLADGRPALVYSCTVRENGQANGRPLGVLGVVFNWEALAQTIVERAPLADHERATTRCVIVDDDGRILADSRRQHLRESLYIPNRQQVLAGKKNYETGLYEGKKSCIAHAQAPGFETYTTGWHSLVIQPLDS